MKERQLAVTRTELMAALADLEGAGKGVGWTVGVAVAMIVWEGDGIALDVHVAFGLWCCLRRDKLKVLI